MQKHDFGKIGFTFEQEYSGSQYYEKNSCVRYNNKLYFSLSDTQGNTPSSESLYWKQLGSDSDVGDQGYLHKATHTLKANKWVQDTTGNRYKYDLGTDLNIVFLEDYDDMDFFVGADINSLTENQLFILKIAQIFGSGQRYLYAYGVKPSIDLPVTIYYY